jgi:hypothetical protein
VAEAHNATLLKTSIGFHKRGQKRRALSVVLNPVTVAQRVQPIGLTGAGADQPANPFPQAFQCIASKPGAMLATDVNNCLPQLVNGHPKRDVLATGV